MKSETLSDWYREVPYQSLPFWCTHPDNLYVQAMLAGLKAPDPRTARVLEIGCASGGNLLPMCQTLPDARFVGIDLSSLQIQKASALAEGAGLRNASFRCIDLVDYSDSGGFDYIIAHGVYSWVKAEAREHLLRLCGKLLSPYGVACVSYNTYPGWHVRGMLREAMLRVIGTAGDGLAAKERAGRARGVAESLARATKLADPTWGSLVRLAVDAIGTRSDDQLLHDDLEPINQPVYFREFNADVERNGLRYLCSADPALEPGDRLPNSISAEIAKLTNDPCEREQYLDVVLNRSYRESILYRSDVNIQPDNRADILKTVWLASSIKPASAAEVNPATAAVLAKLYRAWPAALHFKELEADQSDLVASEMLSLFYRGLIEVWGRPCDFVGISNRVSPLARLQAVAGGPVTNLRHRALQFDPDIMKAIAGEPVNRSASQINLLTWHSLMLG